MMVQYGKVQLGLISIWFNHGNLGLDHEKLGKNGDLNIENWELSSQKL